MFCFFLIILLLPLWGVRFVGLNDGRDFLDKRITTSVNGIFILWVLLRHAQDYIAGTGYHYLPWIDSGFFFFDNLFGQRIVVLFLFFSGYGVMESIKRKGDDYIKAFPKRRILATWVNFVVAVGVFIVAAVLLGRTPGLKQSLLALVAYDSVGNSDWYIFAILMCYLATYFSFLIFRRQAYAAWFQCGLIVCLVATLYFLKGSWWYNTVLSYSFGMLFSCYRLKVVPILKRFYWLMLLGAVILTCTWKYVPVFACGIEKNVSTLAYALMMILGLMRVQIGNPVLEWLGARLFPIYIYQRLPMILIASCCEVSIASHPHLFIAVSALLTFGIAAFYHHWQVKFK